MQSGEFQVVAGRADSLLGLRASDVQSLRVVDAAGMTYQPPDIKWKEIVQEILDEGWSVYRIAKALNCAQCTVWNWLKGRKGEGGEPRFSYGCVLIELHRDVCRKENVATTTKLGSPVREEMT